MSETHNQDAGSEDRRKEEMYTQRTWIDFAGAFTSWVCVAHCLLLPFAVGFLSLIGLGFIVSETTESVILGISLLIALISLVPAYLTRHKSLAPSIFVFSGLVGILLTQMYLEESFVWAAIALVSAAIFITAGHLLNRKLCNECEACEA